MSAAGDAPRALGPFRLGRVLGTGGMGVVHEATHAESGERVAIKTVRVPDPGLLHGMRREIHALAALRHPGIVRIVAHGVDGGLPWYAMTFLEGPTLRDELAAALPESTTQADDGVATVPLPDRASKRTDVLTRDDPASGSPAGTGCGGPLPGGLPRALTVVRRLCDALAYMHGEGIVHRDLKPENILLSRDDRPVIVDLGLVGRFAAVASRETLEGTGESAGTAPYMAPEQIRGDPVDARADLYAVGCILHEVVTGRPPFLTRSIPELLDLHARALPAPPSRWAAGLPSGLDDLVLSLLAKDPRERIGHASAVARILDRLGATPEPSKAHHPRPYLYRPRLVGRSPELQALVTLAAAAARDRGGVVGIGGESGVGKTRLALEIATRSRQRGFRVVTSECGTAAESRAVAPLAPFGRLLVAVADRCRELGAEGERRLLGEGRAVLSRYEPSLVDLPGGPVPAPVELPPEDDVLRVREALLGTLDALARERPVLLLIDDAQWADDETLRFLAWICRGHRLEGVPVAIVVTYREEETSPELRLLLESPGFASILLRRLPPEDVSSVVADMLGLESPDTDLARAILGHSEGNPLFVAEYLRAAVGEGLLSQADDGRWVLVAPAAAYQGLSLPDSVAALMARRFERLSPRAREVLEAAAVIGRLTPPHLLGAVALADDDGLLDPITELLARHVLEDAPDGALSFPHDKIREAAYRGVPPATRALLHARAAGALAAGARPGPRDLEEIAVHWERAGDAPRARDAYLAAARAAPAHAPAMALRTYRRHLALADPGRLETLAARLELAEILSLSGPAEEYAVEAERALRDARDLAADGLLGRACRHVSRVRRRVGAMGEARALLEEAVGCHRRAGEVVEEGVTLGELAGCVEDAGAIQEAESLYRRAVALFQPEGRPEAAPVLIGYGGHLRVAGRLDEAQAAFEGALRSARAAGDLRGEANALGNLANVATDRGRLDDARPLYEASFAIFRRIGERRGEAVSIMNQAKLALETGRMEAAIELLLRARATLEALADRRLHAHTLTTLAEVYHRNGQWREAFGSNEEGLAMVRELGDMRRIATALSRRGQLLVREGREDEGARDLEEALSMFRAQGSLAQVADVLVLLGVVELSRGRLERADELGTEAEGAYAAAGNVPGQANVLVGLGATARLRGDAGAAAANLARAEEILVGSASVGEIVLCACEAGHQALARGDDGRPHLRRAEALIAGKDLGADAEAPRAVDVLRRSIETAEGGGRVLRGQDAETLPVPLRERVERGAALPRDGYTAARGALAMTELAKMRCIPCQGGVPPIEGEKLAAYAAEVPAWTIVNGHHLARDYSFPDFAAALAFVNRVGEMAEDQGHHPDMHLSWGKVSVEVWTHKIDGLTESDFIFAARCDALHG